MTPEQLRLYLVADPEHVSGDLTIAVRQALAGGVRAVQLRSKTMTDREALALAREIRAACHDAGAVFIVNDRLDIALASGADGVHLGVDDLPVDDARQIAGADFVIGFSPETDEQIRSAGTRGASYLGVGPVFGTATKADAGDALGIDEFARRCSISLVPVVGIGGITLENAKETISAGAAGVAVVSAILGSGDPRGAAEALYHQVTTSAR